MTRVNFSASGLSRKLFAILAIVLILPLQAIANTLQDISYSALPGNSVQVVLTLQDPIEMPASFSTDNPARIAIDLENTESALQKKTQTIGVGMARSVTAIQAGNKTRVVLNLVSAVKHEIKTDDNRIVVNIGGGAGAGAATVNTQQTAEASLMTDSSSNIAAIDFRRGDDGKGEVIVKLSDPNAVVDMRSEGGNLVLEVIETRLPEELARKLDVSDFATPVQSIETRSSGNNVRIEIVAIGDYDHLAYQLDDSYVLEVRPLTRQELEKLQQERRVFSGERLSLNFQDIEVRSVLQLLADFTELNMVVSDSVSGNLTLRLKNVPWDQALDIILKTKGLSMRKNENVVLIAPTQEITKWEKDELESQKQIEELAPLRMEIVRINYSNAEDVAQLLRSSGVDTGTVSSTSRDPVSASSSSASTVNLLSSRGEITVDTRTNSLLIMETAERLANIRELIAQLDVPVPQVMIESRIVVANNDYAKDIGARLGASLDEPFKEGILGNSTLDVSGALAGDLLVNLPQTLAQGSGGAIDLVLARVGSHVLSLELTAMQQEGKGEIISSPRLITADQSRATIKQGVEIPYQEASSSGATTVSFKEAVLQLDVTPHITPDDRVKMDLVISKDSPDFSRAVLNVPPVDTREIQTTVLVDNGETVVLGGVFERTKTNNTNRVPFFGDLPYVGFMFKQEQVNDENSELLIFVTPKILKETLTLN
ncbi:MAG: type IV pilus secretin PilQ [Chromatiales bacterium]|jgi:type IV pilus assembly protein PilQ